MAAVMPFCLSPLPVLLRPICIQPSFPPIPQNHSVCFNGKICKAIRWTPPPVGWVKLNVDGSSKGNPGQAASGGICRTSQGKWLFGFTTRIGFQNSLVAELHAIMQGMQMAWNSGFRFVVIESDCKVAVDRILAGHDENGHDLTSKLVIMSRQLLQRNWHCKLMHIYREGNYCADFLASNFQHLPMGETVYLQPPPNLLKLLEDDFAGTFRIRTRS